ncbi:hypothetical protein ACFRIB_41915 [Streptomyces mirabilis]|uniref:hypothetical protein n=1 Tax=Streptomyces mirabilis TaxID=68239 RepID=UPI0036745060
MLFTGPGDEEGVGILVLLSVVEDLYVALIFEIGQEVLDLLDPGERVGSLWQGAASAAAVRGSQPPWWARVHPALSASVPLGPG